MGEQEEAAVDGLAGSAAGEEEPEGAQPPLSPGEAGEEAPWVPQGGQNSLGPLEGPVGPEGEAQRGAPGEQPPPGPALGISRLE